MDQPEDAVLGLINRGLKGFVETYHDAETWRKLVSGQSAIPEDFEALADYPLEVTVRLVAEISTLRDASEADVYEDLGTFLVSTHWDARLRLVFMSCADDFVKFLQRLDVVWVALNAVDAAFPLNSWEISSTRAGAFRLSGPTLFPGFPSLCVGMLRSLADEFGAYVIIDQKPYLSHVFDFDIEVFDSGHSPYATIATKDMTGLRDFIRAELLQIILDDARQAISRLQDARDLAESEADLDPLTGLLNRRGLEKWWLRSRCILGEFAVFAIDLDRFKQINDQYGHATGDFVLKTIAARLQGLMRPLDVVARLGGDEFVAILMLPKQANDCKVVRRIQTIFDDPIAVQNSILPVFGSVGCAWRAGETDHSLNTLIQIADAALYQAKGEGQGGCSVKELASVVG
ncbi:MAG: diguanylate cyclase [Pseudomonadota bacterium]